MFIRLGVDHFFCYSEATLAQVEKIKYVMSKMCMNAKHELRSGEVEALKFGHCDESVVSAMVLFDVESGPKVHVSREENGFMTVSRQLDSDSEMDAVLSDGENRTAVSFFGNMDVRDPFAMVDNTKDNPIISTASTQLDSDDDDDDNLTQTQLDSEDDAAALAQPPLTKKELKNPKVLAKQEKNKAKKLKEKDRKASDKKALQILQRKVDMKNIVEAEVLAVTKKPAQGTPKKRFRPEVPMAMVTPQEATRPQLRRRLQCKTEDVALVMNKKEEVVAARVTSPQDLPIRRNQF